MQIANKCKSEIIQATRLNVGIFKIKVTVGVPRAVYVTSGRVFPQTESVMPGPGEKNARAQGLLR